MNDKAGYKKWGSVNCLLSSEIHMYAKFEENRIDEST